MADGKRGLMIGASAGGAFYNVDDFGGSPADLEDTDFAWKVFVGYRFGWFAVEADYRDFGQIQTKSGPSFSIATQAFDLAGVAMIPIGPFDIIGKVGATAWDTDIGGVDLSEDGTDLMYGIGAAIRLGFVGIRLELERFDIDPEPIDMVTLGVAFTF
jgi:hypothetical protein